jgi:hypothetical protein
MMMMAAAAATAAGRFPLLMDIVCLAPNPQKRRGKSCCIGAVCLSPSSHCVSIVDTLLPQKNFFFFSALLTFSF